MLVINPINEYKEGHVFGKHLEITQTKIRKLLYLVKYLKMFFQDLILLNSYLGLRTELK